MITLNDCLALDNQDPLRPLRDLFELPPGVIYLDGNSLGALPKTAGARVAQVVAQEWGVDLIRSWNKAGWFEMPQRLGDKIARLVGAGAGEVVVTDSTSVNLYKVLSAALDIAAKDTPRAAGERRIVVSERSNFPTDLYIAHSLCEARGFRLQLVESAQINQALTAEAAVLLLTHVNYRTGAMFDMAAICRAARQAGVLTVWDLAHSAGAVEVDLTGSDADFAVGCGYKFLNGGPGAPAFVWVNPRHLGRRDGAGRQPLSGWWAHAAPFAFTPEFTPSAGINAYLCGTPPVLNMAALECGLDTLLAAEPLGGMAALRRKSSALTDLFISLTTERCAAHGLSVATPLAHAERGSQVSLAFDGTNTATAGAAYAVMQALISRGVIGDFRAGEPDLLRFGFTPLYLGFEDVWRAAELLSHVLDSHEWQRPEFHRQQAVT